MVELDLQLTADGTLVAFHDRDLRLLSQEAVPVESLSLDQLADAVYLDRRGKKAPRNGDTYTGDNTPNATGGPAAKPGAQAVWCRPRAPGVRSGSGDRRQRAAPRLQLRLGSGWPWCGTNYPADRLHPSPVEMERPCSRPPKSSRPSVSTPIGESLGIPLFTKRGRAANRLSSTPSTRGSSPVGFWPEEWLACSPTTQVVYGDSSRQQARDRRRKRHRRRRSGVHCHQGRALYTCGRESFRDRVHSRSPDGGSGGGA